MTARLTRATALALASALLLAGCSSSGDDGENGDGEGEVTVEPGPARAELQLPAEPVSVLPEEDPAALALAASSTFFASAPVVVLAEADNPTSVLRGAGAGIALAAPVLLTGDDVALAGELDRLGAEAVLSFGGAALPASSGAGSAGDDAAGDDGDDGERVLVAAPDDDAALAELLGLDAGDRVVIERLSEIPTLAGLTRGEFTPVEVDAHSFAMDCGADCAADGDAAGDEQDTSDGDAASDAPTDESDADDTGAAADASGTEDTDTADADDAATDDAATDDAGTDDADPTDAPAGPTATELPATEPAEPLTGVLALARGSIDDAAAAASAAAAGAALAVAPGGDPRSSSESVAAIAEAQVDVVVGLGAAFDDAETLEWRVTTAATGVELPGGGQLVFPDKRYVALYGTPSTTVLGVLGEQDVDGTIARAAEHAAAYDDLSNEPVIPALEIITTVASSSAGSDGNYSNELPAETLLPLIEAAEEAGQYVVLDLQPGRSSFLEQAQLYAELLEHPHVGLALDPEWNLGPGEVHMVQIGTTTHEEVNEVADWLADFTRERSLPQKMLVLHQFQVRMIQTVPEVDLSRSEIAVLVHVDGQGSQPAKQGTWATLRANGPDIEWWGWKNFYDEDVPMLTPEETAQVVPFPDFISYQ